MRNLNDLLFVVVLGGDEQAHLYTFYSLSTAVEFIRLIDEPREAFIVYPESGEDEFAHLKAVKETRR